VRRRAGALRAGFAALDDFAALEARFAVGLFAAARLAAGFRAADERLVFVAADFARAAEVERLALVERFAVARFVGVRFAVERFAGDLRAAGALARAGLSSLHLPDITRCAASATASAMIEPSRVALDIMLFAACDALSAASSPASRIARRAFGLALIAAAAAASPAASISLLIAALASLSTVALPDDLELLREDLAIASSPVVSRFAELDTSNL